MRTMEELLEEDREKLVAELTALDLAAAEPVLKKELQRLQIRFNETCSDPMLRSAAAAMLTAAGGTAALVNTAGETSVWNRGGDLTALQAGEGRKKKSLGLLAVGAGCILLSIFWGANTDNVTIPLLIAAAGIVMTFFSGRMGAGAAASQRAGSGSRAEEKVDIRVDPSRIYRVLKASVLQMDRTLKELLEQAAWDRRNQAADCGRDQLTGFSAEEIDLFVRILEAGINGEAEDALEAAAEVRFFLHKAGIEAVDYAPDTEKLFDLLPGQQETIRPALLKDGQLIRRGLAAVSR